jgi:DNA-binding MarR family transcriptional regulator
MNRIAVGDIDNVIHGRLRLGIMAYLADVEIADFAELKRVLDATQGNLGANLITLEEAGYITIEKSFVGRKPLTRARITRAGREAFRRYLLQMATLVESGLKT